MSKNSSMNFIRWASGKMQIGKFLIYFLIVNLLVAGFIGTLLYIRSASVLETETIESSRNMLVQMNKSTDLILGQADKFLTQLVMDPYICSFMDYYGKNDLSTQFKISESLNNVLLTNNYISSIHIYYYKEEKVFSLNRGVISMDYFPDKEIIERVKANRGAFEWIPSRKIYDEKSDNMINVITVIKPVPQVRYDPVAAAIVNIDQKYLSNIMSSIVTSKELELLVLNEQGNVVSRNSKNRPLDIASYMSVVFDLKEGHTLEKIGGQKMLVSYVASNINGWKYVSVIPYKVITQKIAFIKNYAVTISLIGILLGIMASLFFSNRIYKPINALAGMFRSSDSQQAEKDTFKYIKNNIVQLKEKNESIEKVLNDHMPVLRNNFIDSLLKGGIAEKEEIFRKLEYYHIDLDLSGSFCVYIISIDNFKSFSSGYSQRQINMLVVYLTQILSSFVYESCRGVVANINESDIVMIISFSITEASILHKEKMKLEEEIQQVIHNSMKGSTSIGVGRLYPEISGISTSYFEAVEALHCRFILGKSRLIQFDEVKALRDESFIYPFEIQDQLASLLKQGDVESVFRTHEKFLAAMMRNKDPNPNIVYYYFMQLLSSVIKAAYDVGINVELIFSGKNLYGELLECKNENSVDEWFRILYEGICRQIEQRKRSKNHGIVDIIAKFIRENYYEDLSLYTLSQQVYMSIPNLSRIFRNEKGITLKQYINEVRMEKAKELLQNPRYKVNEVGEKVGYDKVHGFLKQFKEYTGMTPGEYRMMLIDDHGDRSKKEEE